MSELAFVTYGFVLGVMLAGGVGWLCMDWQAKEIARYRRLFMQAAGQIQRARRGQ